MTLGPLKAKVLVALKWENVLILSLLSSQTNFLNPGEAWAFTPSSWTRGTMDSETAGIAGNRDKAQMLIQWWEPKFPSPYSEPDPRMLPGKCLGPQTEMVAKRLYEKYFWSKRWGRERLEMLQIYHRVSPKIRPTQKISPSTIFQDDIPWT